VNALFFRLSAGDHLWRQREAARLAAEIAHLESGHAHSTAAAAAAGGAAAAPPSAAALRAQLRALLAPAPAPPAAPPDYFPTGQELWGYDDPWGPYITNALKALHILTRCGKSIPLPAPPRQDLGFRV